MAIVLAVNISEKKGVPKKPIEKGYFEVDHGLVGDAHAKNWHRQVSLLGKESMDKLDMEQIKGDCKGIFAENITTEGVILYELSIGTKLKIGETEMEVTHIGKECHLYCSIRTIAGDCAMPGECIFAKVLKPGWIKPGDKIELM